MFYRCFLPDVVDFARAYSPSINIFRRRNKFIIHFHRNREFTVKKTRMIYARKSNDPSRFESRSTRRMHVYCTLEDTELAINLANSLSKPTHYKPPKSPVPITARNEHVRGAAAAAAARKLASSLEFPRRKLDNRKAKGKEERHPR